MKAVQNPAALSELLRRAQEHKEEREPGVHVSDIVRCRRMYWYAHNGYPQPPHDESTLLLFLMGAGHHAFLQCGATEEKLSWTGPSGVTIHANVDFDEPDVDGPTELKTTRASAKKTIFDMQHYVEQVISYAVMKSKREARLDVFHLLGDYTGPKKSTGVAWDIFPTDEELARWAVEMDRRALVCVSPEIPSILEHHDWECDYCPYLAKRGGPCEGGKGSKMVWFPNDSALEDARRNFTV